MTDPLNGRVTRFEQNEANVDAWAKGDSNTSVDFGGGAVRSPAKLIRDNDAVINASGLLAVVASGVATTAQNAQNAQTSAQQAAVAGRAYPTTAAALADAALAAGASFSAPLSDGSMQSYTKTSGTVATAIGAPFLALPAFQNVFQPGFSGPFSGYLSAVVDELQQIIEGINVAGQKENWLQQMFMALATFKVGLTALGLTTLADVQIGGTATFTSKPVFNVPPSFSGGMELIDDGLSKFTGWYWVVTDANGNILLGIDTNLNLYAYGTENRLKLIESNIAANTLAIANLQSQLAVGGYADAASWSVYADSNFALRSVRKSDGQSFLLTATGDRASNPTITADGVNAIWRSSANASIANGGLMYRKLDGSAPAYPAMPLASIAAWGDSMTQGVGSTSPNTYCEILASLTGLPVYNGGVGGQTSTQIAARQGGKPLIVSVAGQVIPGTGAAVAVNTISISPLNQNAQPQNLTGTIGGAAVKLVRTNGSSSTDVFTLQQSTATGTDLNCPDGSTLLVDTFGRDSWVTVIYSGYNGGSILADTQAMASFLKSLNKRFLVLSLPSGATPYDTSDTKGYNNSLAAAFPNNFADLRSYLVAQYDPSIPQDVIDHGNNIVPSSIVSSQPHLNAKGQLAQATFVYNQLKTRGWI